MNLNFQKIWRLNTSKMSSKTTAGVIGSQMVTLLWGHAYQLPGLLDHVTATGLGIRRRVDETTAAGDGAAALVEFLGVLGNQVMFGIAGGQVVAGRVEDLPSRCLNLPPLW